MLNIIIHTGQIGISSVENGSRQQGRRRSPRFEKKAALHARDPSCVRPVSRKKEREREREREYIQALFGVSYPGLLYI